MPARPSLPILLTHRHVYLHIQKRLTYGCYGHHGSTAASITVGGHNTDGVYHIVGHSDWNTCSTGGDWTEAWTDSDGVVDWSPTIILWELPLHCEGYTVPTILLNSGGGSEGRRGETCQERKKHISEINFVHLKALQHCLSSSLFLFPCMQNDTYTCTPCDTCPHMADGTK